MATNSEIFIRKIEQAIATGRGFVPLIGTGVSAPAGVPILREIHAYLKRCLWLAMPVGHQPDETSDSDPRRDPALDRPWNPRIDAWPSLDASEFNSRDGDELLSNLFNARLGNSSSSSRHMGLLRQTRDAASDWRSALLLLSRLELDLAVREVSTGARDDRVVDQFFKHILKDKSPSLCHKMLAHLADRLRFCILLTTNFDDLLEQAFEERGSRLTTFDVHLNGKLPAVELLHGYNAFVKLHGGRYELRADYTLDETPSRDDLDTVLSYLKVGRESRDVGSEALHGVKNHLLVMGTSVNDLRVESMIRDAWTKLPGLKIFWICHTRHDERKAADFAKSLQELLSDNNHEVGDDPNQREFIAIQHSALGLFLLELYQHLHQTLPPSGIPFPAAARIAVPPVKIPFDNAASNADRFATCVRMIYDQWDTVRQYTSRRVVAVASPPGVVGVTSAAGEVFQRLTDEGQECVWIDLDDVVSADDLFEQILESVNSRAGVPDWVPMVQSADRKSRGQVLAHAVSHLGKRWVLFLNAREAAGVNLVYDAVADAPAYMPEVFNTNGWLDLCDAQPTSIETPNKCEHSLAELREELRRQRLLDDTTSREAFLRLLNDVTGPECPSVSCILMCRHPPIDNRTFKPGASHRGEPPQIEGDELHDGSLVKALWNNDYRHFIMEREGVAKSVVEMNRTLDDAFTAGKFPEFLFSIVLMRRTRYLASVATIAAKTGGGTLNWDDTVTALSKLEVEQPGLIRRKPGGFVWLHCRFRDQVRHKYMTRFGDQPKTEWFRKLRTTYRDLATTCEQLHLATLSPTAAFEAIYHALQSLVAHLRHELQASPSSTTSDDFFPLSMFALVRRVLAEAETRIMYLGFSKGRCRRLEQIRDVYLTQIMGLAKKLREPALKKSFLAHCAALRKICVRMKSRIAREVAEHRKAYQREREYRRLLVDSQALDISDAAPFNGDMWSPQKIDPVAWINWWRHVGTLGIASRAYSLAQRAFDRGLREAVPAFDDAEWGQRPEQFAESFIGNYRKGNADEFRLALGKLFVRRLQLNIARSKLSQRLNDDDTWRTLAERDYRAGSHLLQSVQSPRLWFGVRNNLRRLETYRALIETSKPNGSFEVARAHLSAAEQHGMQADPKHSKLSDAVVELHKADVSISEVMHYRSSGFAFAQWRDDLLKLGQRIDVKLRTARDNDAVRERVGAFLSDDARKVKGIVLYALSALDRARPILLRNERNVWWSTWYFERRLKSIELMIWATANDKGGRIPFFGLEAATSVTHTVVDELLDDGDRMVRLDVYRLATIVEAYMNCLLAMRVRLRCDDGPHTDRLIKRQNDMRNRLSRAAGRLNDLKDDRISGEVAATLNKRFEHKHELDDDVTRYVESVCKSVHGVLKYTGEPIH